MEKRLEKKHPLAIRWLHRVDFPLLTLMMWSGLLIYWSNSVYGIRLFGRELFHFFPQGFFEALGVPFRLAEGMSLHFLFMWFFLLNGVLCVLYTALSGEWRFLVPTRRSFREAIQVTLHDLHLSKYQPPRRKFDGAQQIAYTSVVLMGAGSASTGLAIYKPVSFGWLTSLAGGYEWARWEHFRLARCTRKTLLCYEMNGQPLTPAHGAPLRPVTPVKYGIKHIKRIGRITFTDERPGDFRAERGYDWYSGH